MKDLCNETYKTLMKEIEEDTNRKTSCAPGLEELVLIKCPDYPKLSTNSMQSPSKYEKHSTQK